MKCAFCGTKLQVHGGAGHPRIYCDEACRQAMYRRRKAGIVHSVPVDDRVKSGGRLRLTARLGLK